jgi:hypothetical protein
MQVPQRGRAIVRKLSSQEPLQSFRPGDFLLTRSGGFLARIFGWATGSKLNHAALIVDPLGTVVEVTPSLVVPGQAFRISSVGEYLRSGAPCWVGYVELAGGTRQDVMSYAQHFVRARCETSLSSRLFLALYMLLGIGPHAWTAKVRWLNWLHTRMSPHMLVLREGYTYTSSEFVARALERGGFIWERDPALITPHSLFEQYHPEDRPAMPERTLIRLRKRQKPAAQTAAPRQPGIVTPFAPRAIRGATALAEEPRRAESAPEGTWALVQVGIIVAAGLAMIGILEEVLRMSNVES